MSKRQTVRQKQTENKSAQPITIFISVLAVLLSALTVYYNFFRVSNRLVGTVSTTVFNDENITTHYSFSNPGNQTLVIADVSLKAVYPNGSYKIINNPTFSPNPSTILKAGDVQVFSALAIFSPADFYSDAELDDGICQLGERIVSIVMDIHTVDSKGNNIASRMPISKVCIDQNTVHSWVGDTNPLNLFNEPYKILFVPSIGNP